MTDSESVMGDGLILGRTLPRTLDALLRQVDDQASHFCAWLFEDQEARRQAESRMAVRGVKARIRSAYKPLLHFFLEEVELSGLRSVAIETPNHALAHPQRFRVETYPLAGLLRDVPIRFSEGDRSLHYVVTLQYGQRRVVHEVFAPNRERSTPSGARALSPCGWVGDAQTGHPVQTEFESAFHDIMDALQAHPWGPAPHFDVLRMTVRTGGIERRLFHGDECISTREALHEDLYFSVLEFFQHRDGRTAGDRTFQPGQIVPDIRFADGPTQISVQLQTRAQLHAPGDEAPQPLDQAESPLAPKQLAEEVARLGGTRFDGRSVRGTPVLATEVDGKGLGLVVSAGQHANETSGVVGALRAAAALKARGMKFSLVPQENPDGYALHRELRQHNPRHALHAARYTAMGDDVAFREAEPLAESAVRFDAFRREQVRLHVNLHGYPAHEWTRPHTGYVPRDSFLWMVPRGFFLIVRHHAGFEDMAERFVRALAERVSATPGLKEFNESHLKTFEAHIGSLPFKIQHGIPFVVGVSESFVPRFTLVAEYPDETIYGDAFRLAHTVQMATVIEAARLLEEGWLPAGN